MLFLAASKRNYFHWTQEQHVRGYEGPWERTNMGEHCSSTEFPSVTETASQELFDIDIHF